MINFKKVVPRKKDKKRPTSAKRSSSLTEENKHKKINNSERLFTYNEVFEQLNSKICKKQKFKANSASKKKKSLSKNKKTKSIEKKNFRNIWTNNTYCTTMDTDNNKIKINKISPKKIEFGKMLEKAKDLLSMQSDLVIQCGKLSQNLSKSDLEISERLKNEINKNGTNTLPGLAKALYLLECKKDNKQINYGKNNYNFKNKNEEIENSFYIQKLNELNGFIGELGYSYVYNEFDNFNYKKENLVIYFDNIQKLLNSLHQTINEQKEILMNQANQIKEYERIIHNYQKDFNEYNNYNNLINNQGNNESNNFNENSIISNNENKNIIINENMSYNYNENSQNLNENNNHNTNSCFFNNLSSQDFDKFQECKNVFKNNINNNSSLKNNQTNTHYFNSYINNNKDNYQQNNENSLSESGNNYTNFDENKKQNLPPELSNNYLNYYNEKNVISSMINSNSFFESYKRNKELKHNLNYNYNEKSVNNE